MKKLTMSVLAIAFAANAAFGEITFKFSSSIYAMGYEKKVYVEDASGDKKETIKWIDLNGTDASSGKLEINARNSSKTAGAYGAITLYNYEKGAYTTVNDGTLYKTGDVACTSEFYGWMQKQVFGNNFRLQFGRIDDRYTPRYNVTYTDKGLTDTLGIANWGISPKLSTAYATRSSSAYTTVLVNGKHAPLAGAKDNNNFAAHGGTRELNAVARYTVANLIPNAELQLQAGFVDNDAGLYKTSSDVTATDYDTTDDDDTTTTVNAGFAYRAALKLKNIINIEGVVKTPTVDTLSVGSYFTLLCLPKPFTVAAGYTWAMDEQFEGYKTTGYAFDARFMYRQDPFGVILQGKYTRVNYDWDSGLPTDKDALTYDYDSSLEFCGEFAYIINETFTIATDAALVFADFDNNDGKKNAVNYAEFRQNLEINFASGVYFVTAVDFKKFLDRSKTDSYALLNYAISVPFILKVTF